LGPRSRPAAPSLVAALKDPDKDVRSVAAFALGEISPGAPHPGDGPRSEVVALARALRQEADHGARLWAAQALVKFGADAWVAVPALRQALSTFDKGLGVAEVAADVLARLRPAAVEILGEALQDPECPARSRVAQYLGELGPRARAALPSLMR